VKLKADLFFANLGEQVSHNGRKPDNVKDPGMRVIVGKPVHSDRLRECPYLKQIVVVFV